MVGRYLPVVLLGALAVVRFVLLRCDALPAKLDQLSPDALEE